MSAEEAYFALQSIEHRLAPGALRPFIEANSAGLGSCPVSLLPGLVESKLADPANAKFLKPAHELGSVEAFGAAYRQDNKGGLFGPPNPGAKLPAAPVPTNTFQPAPEVKPPSTDVSLMQRGEALARRAQPNSLFGRGKL
jgi:hypothetical protein